MPSVTEATCACVRCGVIKPVSAFVVDHQRLRGYAGHCKACKNSERARQRRASSGARSAERAWHKGKEIRPGWADFQACAFFYECRPAECHVDHIIPRRGTSVTGLHVEQNLDGFRQSKIE